MPSLLRTNPGLSQDFFYWVLLVKTSHEHSLVPNGGQTGFSFCFSMHFSASLTASRGHMTQFWPVRYRWKSPNYYQTKLESTYRQAVKATYWRWVGAKESTMFMVRHQTRSPGQLALKTPKLLGHHSDGSSTQMQKRNTGWHPSVDNLPHKGLRNVESMTPGWLDITRGDILEALRRKGRIWQAQKRSGVWTKTQSKVHDVAGDVPTWPALGLVGRELHWRREGRRECLAL